MTPRPRRPTGRRAAPPSLNEAAQLTQRLLDAGYTKRDVATILGRDPSLVSQFFTKNKGAAFVTALHTAVQAMDLGAAADIQELQAIAAPHIQRRTTRTGTRARVRVKDVVATPGHSSMARAATQHIASGAARLRPVVAHAAAVGGRIAFSVRAKKDAFVYDSGRPKDSLGIRRGVVQRADGTEERSYGNSAGPGLGEAGFDAADWQQRIDATGGDVAAAVRDWLVQSGRLKPGAPLTHIEVRSWKPPH